MYVPESDTEALEICRLPLGSTVKLPPDTQQNRDEVMFPDTHTCIEWSYYLWLIY